MVVTKAKTKIVLGIDGGGTKTEAVLMDADFNVLSRGFGGPSNKNFVPAEVVESSLRNAIETSLHNSEYEMSRIKVVGGCFAGRTSVLEPLLNDFSYNGVILDFSEFDVAFERAGVKEPRGIAVIAGTGSSFWGSNGSIPPTYIGGWGPVAGEEGSGFFIGLRGVQAAGRAFDGRGPMTVLLQKALEHFKVQDFTEILITRCRPAIDQLAIASFAKVVTDAAKQGDLTAIRIIEEAASHLSIDTVFLCKKFFSPEDEFPVVLAGGVFDAGDIITGPIKKSVLESFPKAKVLLPAISPGVAVARLTVKTFADKAIQF